MTDCRHDNITTLTNDGVAGRTWACSQCGVRFANLDTLDAERLAQALDKITDVGIYPNNGRTLWQEGWNAACMAIAVRLDDHAAVAKAYREDTDA